jgi:hypothetical protein
MPGTWTPPGLNNLALTVNSNVGFHVIKRVARTGIHFFRGSSASRHLRHSGLYDSLHTLRKGSSPSFPQCWLRHEIRSFSLSAGLPPARSYGSCRCLSFSLGIYIQTTSDNKGYVVFSIVVLRFFFILSMIYCIKATCIKYFLPC